MNPKPPLGGIQIVRIGPQIFSNQHPYRATNIRGSQPITSSNAGSEYRVRNNPVYISTDLQSHYPNQTNRYVQMMSNPHMANSMQNLIRNQPQPSNGLMKTQSDRSITYSRQIQNTHIPIQDPPNFQQKQQSVIYYRTASFKQFTFEEPQQSSRININMQEIRNALVDFQSYKSYELIGQSEIDCPVCAERIYSDTIISIDGCRDSLHKSCLLPYLQNQIRDGKVERIMCPLATCSKKSIISERFLRKILSPDDLERYFRFSESIFIGKLLNKQQFIACPEPGCQQLFRRIKNPEARYMANKNLLQCSKTFKKICAICGNNYHPQFTCQEYLQSADPKLNQKKVLELIMKEKWSQCPKCKVYVEKNQGCDHITCRCGNHFCYKCRGQYPNCNCPGARERMNYIPAQQPRVHNIGNRTW